MKFLHCSAIALFISATVFAQNTGIGTSTPVQTLDVNGAVKVGTSNNNQPGSIRYNAGNFEGGDGSTWKTLGGLPSKAVIVSQAEDTASIKAAGFSVLRQMELWDTGYINIPTNYPGSWSAGFPLSSTVVTPPVAASNETVMHNNRFIIWGSDAYLYAYDIPGQLWIRLPNICPLGIRNSCGVTLVGNEVYITGGWRFSGGFIIYNTCAKYNLTTNTWSIIANIPVNNCYHATAAIGNDIYLLDGSSTASSGFDFTKKMYRYNTVSNTWSADLAVAATPDYLLNNSIVSWNNKLVYHTGNLRVATYDPVTHALTLVNPSVPYDSPYMESFSIALAGDKLLIAGNIKDSSTIEPITDATMPKHFEVDLNTGNMVQLNTCQLQKSELYLLEYNPASDRYYARGENNYFIFNRSGSESCDVVLQRKAYWFYMKKN